MFHSVAIKLTAVYEYIQDDTFLEKLGSKLFNYDDHEAEVHKAQTFPLATEAAAKVCNCTVNNSRMTACILYHKVQT